MHSYRANVSEATGDSHSMANQYEDEVSLRSLPLTHQHQQQNQQAHYQQSLTHPCQQPLYATHVHLSNLNPPRSMSPVSSMSGDELSHGAGGRRSQRRRPLLDKQLSENSSLLSGEDAVSERVRFDDNISFIDDSTSVGHSLGLVGLSEAVGSRLEAAGDQVINTSGGGNIPNTATTSSASIGADNISLSSGRLLNKKMERSILTEETAEELAEVISPELKPRKSANLALAPTQLPIPVKATEATSVTSTSNSQPCVTLLRIGETSEKTYPENQLNEKVEAVSAVPVSTTLEDNNDSEAMASCAAASLKESFSAKL